MTDRPTLLLEHHLKELRLPSFLREYSKMAAQCAAEGVDHPSYLLRLAELELIDRHQRMVQRRIRAARFPAVKSLDTFDFTAIPSVNQALVMELALLPRLCNRPDGVPATLDLEGDPGPVLEPDGKVHLRRGLGRLGLVENAAGQPAIGEMVVDTEFGLAGGIPAPTVGECGTDEHGVFSFLVSFGVPRGGGAGNVKTAGLGDVPVPAHRVLACRRCGSGQGA